jgi:hypothetical protein
MIFVGSYEALTEAIYQAEFISRLQTDNFIQTNIYLYQVKFNKYFLILSPIFDFMKPSHGLAANNPAFFYHGAWQ